MCCCTFKKNKGTEGKLFSVYVSVGIDEYEEALNSANSKFSLADRCFI
jgi:hypothetical protein